MNETHIEHGSYHVIRVPKGSFAVVTEEQRAKLLPEGVHVIDNPIFKFNGLVKASQPYINHSDFAGIFNANALFALIVGVPQVSSRDRRV